MAMGNATAEVQMLRESYGEVPGSLIPTRKGWNDIMTYTLSSDVQLQNKVSCWEYGSYHQHIDYFVCAKDVLLWRGFVSKDGRTWQRGQINCDGRVMNKYRHTVYSPEICSGKEYDAITFVSDSQDYELYLRRTDEDEGQWTYVISPGQTLNIDSDQVFYAEIDYVGSSDSKPTMTAYRQLMESGHLAVQTTRR